MYVSDNIVKLDSLTRKRYNEKWTVIGGVDPYSIERDDANCTEVTFAGITYPDEVNYLILSSSSYTAENKKSYRSFEGYKQAIEGWITQVKDKDKVAVIQWHVDKTFLVFTFILLLLIAIFLLLISVAFIIWY